MADETDTNGSKATKPAAKKKPSASKRITTNYVEYIPLAPALMLNKKGTTRVDRYTKQRTTRARTSRFEGARVYRTGADEMTIQDREGEEYIFSIMILRRLLDRVSDLALTREIPVFTTRG